MSGAPWLKWEFFLLRRANGKEKDKYWDQKMTLPSSRADNPGSTFLFSEVSYNLPKSCQVCIPRPEEKPVALDRAIDDTGRCYIQQRLCDLCLLGMMTGHLVKGDPKLEKLLSQAKLFLAYSFVATPTLYLRDVSSEIEGGFSFFSVAVSTSSSFDRHRWNDELNFYFLGSVQRK